MPDTISFDEGTMMEPLASHAFPLEQAPEAFATQDKPDIAIKILVKP